MTTIPPHLLLYRTLWEHSPREAALQWFRDARYGLFLHYGLYSLLGRGEWVQHQESIPVDEYAKLAEEFFAAKFDANAIAEVAVAAGMRYITFTTRHHDSFALFRTGVSDFHVGNAACKRDLVGELSAACTKRGLGFFAYYSHGRDWRHPHAPGRDWCWSARPEYPGVDALVDIDLEPYLTFMANQVRELLSAYGPLAGVWFDGIGVPIKGDWQRFHCDRLYAMIRQLQPHALISYKQGLTGAEDFFAPEQRVHIRDGLDRDCKPIEICTTMCPGSWSYHAERRSQHRDAAAVWGCLEQAAQAGANLLLNLGPLPDGSLDPTDVETILQVGERLKREGFPHSLASVEVTKGESHARP